MVKQCNQRFGLSKTQFQFHSRHRAGCGHHPHPQPRFGKSIASDQDNPAAHCGCQGQSGKLNFGGPDSNHASTLGRVVQNDDRRQHRPGALPQPDAATWMFSETYFAGDSIAR
jgi:hypothetical protein